MIKSQNNQSAILPRIAIVVTSVYMVRFFLIPHLKALSGKYDVTLILNNDVPEVLSMMELPVRIINIPIQRKIAIFADLKALLLTIKLFYHERFDMIHTMTPKAGLIGIFAAFITQIPCRIHTFQGEVWANKTGFMRGLLRFLDRLVSCFSTNLTVVSRAEFAFLIKENIIPVSKATIIANGSIGGVDLVRFQPDMDVRFRTRDKLGLEEDEIVFLYVGRLNKDKGLITLRDAFIKLRQQNPSLKCKLLIVGPDEDQIEDIYETSVPPELKKLILFEPFTETPEIYMKAADVLVLPSFREGFGVVIIEAAAIGVPSIGSDIYGLKDSLVNGKTGLFFQVGDSYDLSEKMRTLAEDKQFRNQLGHDAKRRVKENYDQKIVIQAFLVFYEERLSQSKKLNYRKDF